MDDLEKKFKNLLKTCKKDTSHLSSQLAMSKHPAYREIVKIGKDAIPLILKNFEDNPENPDHLFIALVEITGADPIKMENRGKIKEMAKDWIAWGQTKGYCYKIEIERKFLVKYLPENIEDYPSFEVEQGYLLIAKEKEIRIRKEDGKYFFTVKIGEGKKRAEPQIALTADQFNPLWPLTKGLRVYKTRCLIPYGKRIIELNFFHGALRGYKQVEVEFDSEEAAREFIPPDWFGKEVTNDSRHANKNLALNGIPADFCFCADTSLAKSLPQKTDDENVKEFIERIKAASSATNNSILVLLAGGSSSGKTEKVTRKLREIFGGDLLEMSTDDYYRGTEFMEMMANKGTPLNWDQPEAVDLLWTYGNITKLLLGNDADCPIYNVKTGKREGVKKISPKKIILLEGTFALHEAFLKYASVTAFIDVGMHGRMIRRLLRDVNRTNWKPENILEYFLDIVEPMHELYVESTRKNAEIIINNEYKPEIEAERSGLLDVQIKFKYIPEPEELRKLGASRLGAINQEDIYYNPKDRDFSKTKEMVRVRKEDEDFIFTYKGPRCNADFCRRAKFEFPINKEIAGKFVSAYGTEVKRITKNRILYQMDGIIIAIDTVIKRENGSTVDLGKFMEIKCTDSGHEDCEKIRLIVEKLGLKLEDGIKKSYIEL